MFVMEVPWGDLWKQTCPSQDAEGLVDFVEDRLGPADYAVVDEHLSKCPVCTAFCEDYKAFLSDEEGE